MDFNGWFRLGDGNKVGQAVPAALLRAFHEDGMPEVIRTDNGQPWGAPKGSLGIARLGVTMESQQRPFDAFRKEDNDRRQHEAIGQRPRGSASTRLNPI